jgi:hypothetical protein
MISVNMEKAKQIAHEKRRAARAKEFAPLDVKATIPAEAAAAEIARQAVRSKYESLQERMDAASTPEELKVVLLNLT